MVCGISVAELIDQTFLVLQESYLVVDSVEGCGKIGANFVQLLNVFG